MKLTVFQHCVPNLNTPCFRSPGWVGGEMIIIRQRAKERLGAT